MIFGLEIPKIPIGHKGGTTIMLRINQSIYDHKYNIIIYQKKKKKKME
jgi:hypothetical protein